MTAVKITVSKTDYILFRECPNNAWYKIHDPELYYNSKLSEFEKAIIETGNDVERKAREFFPTGVLIRGRETEAQQLTQEYISKQEETLFQPIFENDGFLAAIDVLKFDSETKAYSVYEIKATNEIDEKDHYYDLAFQVILLKKMGFKIASANLMHLNSKYVRSGELDIIKLFEIQNVTSEIEGIAEEVADGMDKALKYLSTPEAPKGSCCCVYKGRSKHCSTFKHSNPKVPEYSVHDIARIGSSKAKLQELADVQAFDLHKIPEHIKLSEIQQNQVDAHVHDRVLTQKSRIAEELSGLSFPLYFVDYETFPSAIPRFDGFSPYQQIPFQYSLHVLHEGDTEPKHFEFLHTGSDNPSFSFGDSLRRNIGGKGSVIVWSKKFECKINNDLAIRMPEFKAFMDSVNARVYDLMDIFSKQHYVHKDFRGSTSIKYILPVLVPELSYKKLGIQEGGTASQRWNELTTGAISDVEKKKIADDLREYCKMDTYAMYQIWKHLTELIEKSAS